jgi:hypothetical protein
MRESAVLVGEWTALRKRVNGGSEGEWAILRKRIHSGSEVVGSLTERLDRNRLYNREACLTAPVD